MSPDDGFPDTDIDQHHLSVWTTDPASRLTLSFDQTRSKYDVAPLGNHCSKEQARLVRMSKLTLAVRLGMVFFWQLTWTMPLSSGDSPRRRKWQKIPQLREISSGEFSC